MHKMFIGKSDLDKSFFELEKGNSTRSHEVKMKN